MNLVKLSKHLAAVAFFLISLSGSTAFAVTGYIHARFMYYNHQGNFCPTSRNCTGAKYLESDFDHYLPVSHVKVGLFTTSGTAIGQGVTDANGYVTMQWTNTTAETSYLDWTCSKGRALHNCHTR